MANVLTRFADIMSANINSVLSKAEAKNADKLLEKYIADSERLWKGKTDCIPVHMIGSTIGTHIGPGGIAVAFFAE